MATPTYVALATVTLGSSDSQIIFTSIPATYRDLILVVSATANTSAGFEYNLNADSTSANYSQVQMIGNGSTATSSAETSFTFASIGTSTANVIVQFLDYSATDKHKVSLVRNNRPDVQTMTAARRWANTAAITSIKLYDSAASASFAANSTFSLYGVN